MKLTISKISTALIGILLFSMCGESQQTEKIPGESLGFKSIPNLRDLGGFTTADGSTVKSGLLFRSDQLSHISEEDMQKLADLGLKVDYDLRTEAEIELRPDELPDGVEYVSLDVLADAEQANPAVHEQLMKNPVEANAVLGDGKAVAGFIESYRQFVSLPSAQKAFRQLFLAAGNQQQLPALFHCTTGKDRTGWAAAAFLTLLGVPKDNIMEDYLRSNDYIIPKYQKHIDSFIEGGGDPEIPMALLGVKKEYLDAAYDEMETNYGTIENYFAEGLGIDTKQQRAIKDLYLK